MFVYLLVYNCCSWLKCIVIDRQSSTEVAAGGSMKIQMAIMHPEIIVVEDAMSVDTNALILQVTEPS